MAVAISARRRCSSRSNARQPLLRLRELIAKIGSCAHGLENRCATRFLLLFERRQVGRRRRRFLLAEREFLLSRGEIGGCGIEHLLVAVPFFFKRASRFCACASSASAEAVRTISSAQRSSLVRMRALPRSPSMAIWLRRSRFCRSLGLDRISALRALGMLGFELLHALGLLPNLLAQLIDLRIERHALLIHLRELAGQHDAQLGAHLVAQFGIALGLAGLALQRIHLPRDFFENVVHAVQIRASRLPDALRRDASWS